MLLSKIVDSNFPSSTESEQKLPGICHFWIMSQLTANSSNFFSILFFRPYSQKWGRRWLHLFPNTCRGCKADNFHCLPACSRQRCGDLAKCLEVRETMVAYSSGLTTESHNQGYVSKVNFNCNAPSEK